MTGIPWDELPPHIQDEVLRLYYGISVEGQPYVAEVPVLEIIDKFNLRAKRHAFVDFLPGIPSIQQCEMCRAPVDVQPLSRSDWRQLVRPDADSETELTSAEIMCVPWPGLTQTIPYQEGRTRACARCQHRRGAPGQLPMCKVQTEAATRIPGTHGGGAGQDGATGAAGSRE